MNAQEQEKEQEKETTAWFAAAAGGDEIPQTLDALAAACRLARILRRYHQRRYRKAAADLAAAEARLHKLQGALAARTMAEAQAQESEDAEAALYAAIRDTRTGVAGTSEAHVAPPLPGDAAVHSKTLGMLAGAYPGFPGSPGDDDDAA